MSDSKLATAALLSPCCTVPRKGEILGVAIHCTAGNPDNTALEIARVFQDERRQASCNYAVGGDGSIALVVAESNRAWCTSTGAVDHYAVSVEVASDAKGLVVRPAAVQALINLLVDVCTRNGIKALTWTANKAHAADFSRCNMQVHRWQANKSCPGDYLYNLHGYIRDEVNKRLNAMKEGDSLTEERVKELISQHGADAVRAALADMAKAPADDWAAGALDWAISAGLTDGKRPAAYCTRQEVVTMLRRLYDLIKAE